MALLPRAEVMALALLASLSLSLTACGDDDPGDTGTDTGDPDDLPETDYDIQLVYQTDVSSAQREAFENARRRWGAVILNSQGVAQVDLASQTASGCMSNGEGGVVTTTGVAIIVQVADIDGAGGTLGAAGPCAIRSASGSPVLGIMTFDSADLRALDESGRLETVILHEMGHVIGFGTLWDREDLIELPSVPNNRGVDTHFTGAAARAAFEDSSLAPYQGSIVPVENSAQQGSADGHWREEVLDNELMTPSISGRELTVPMSSITIASLEDFGFYEVNENLAESYAVPVAFNSAGPEEADPDAIDLNCDLIRPQFSIDPSGVATALRR